MIFFQQGKPQRDLFFMRGNNTSEKYDIFISCKSEDYVYAEEIYDYLVENGFRVFLASKELRKLGDSEYRRAIIAALKTAYHMIVFASKVEYIESDWVYYEWDAFINAKLKGFKQGNIFTILKDVQVNDIPMDLWKYESMAFANYKDLLINYVETPEHKQRAEKTEETRKLKRELKQAVDEYNRQQAVLNTIDRRRILSLLLKLGINERACPVCGTKSNIDETFCHTCGWAFNPADGIQELSHISANDPKHIGFLRKYHSRLDEIESIKTSLLTRNQKQEKAIQELTEKNSTLSLQKSTLLEENECLKRDNFEGNRRMEDIKEHFAKEIFEKDSRIDSLNKRLREAEVKADTLSSQLEQSKSQIILLEKTIEKYKQASSQPSPPSVTNTPASATTNNKKYRIFFRTLGNDGKLQLVKFVADTTNRGLAESKRLVDDSSKQFVLFGYVGTEEEAKRITKQIMDISSSTAIYSKVKTGTTN